MAKQQNQEFDEVLQPEEINETSETKEELENQETEEVLEETEEVLEKTEDKKNEKKGPFKKREKKNKQEEQIADLTDRLKRSMAEFDNFRKRSEKEKTQMYEIGAKSVIEKILPVVDNFERALSTETDNNADSAFMEGVDKIYKQLLTELEDIGVKHIEAVGQEFNPDFHNAVMQVESEEFESGIIAQELQKGYLYKDTVVRYSMVAVVE